MQNVEGQKPSSSRSTDRYYSETSNSMDQNMEDEETDMEVDDSPLTDIVKEWSEDGVLDVTPVVDGKRLLIPFLTNSHTTQFWTRPYSKQLQTTNVTKIIISVFDRVENIEGKGEIACTSNFSFSQNFFKRLLSQTH